MAASIAVTNEVLNVKLDSVMTHVSQINGTIARHDRILIGDEEKAGLAILMPLILRLLKWIAGLVTAGVIALVASAGGIYWNLIATWAAMEAAETAATAAEDSQVAIEKRLIPELKKPQKIIIIQPKPMPAPKQSGKWPWD